MALFPAATAALLLNTVAGAAETPADAPAPNRPAACSPAFKPVNHDEDWTALRDPRCRTSPWARLKAVPAGEGWLSLGGEARWRAEYRGHERFGRGPQDDDGDLQQRLRVWADYRPTPGLRLFVDLQDARSVGLDSSRSVTEESHVDFHQAFVEARTDLGEGALVTRLGRQEFALGASRLFEPREGANARTAFDMVRLTYARPTGWSGGLFAGYGLREARGAFDDASDRDYRLFGASASRRLGAGPEAPRLELLYVNTDRTGAVFDTGIAGRDDRHTGSARLDGRAGALDYDAEAVIQRGDFRGLDIRAWYVSAAVGHTFEHAWSPRLSLRLDAASGDKDRADNQINTYNLLHAPPISMRTELGVTNLVSVQPQVTIKPDSRTTVGLLTAGLWRQSREDGVYLLSGLPVRSGIECRSRYVGWRYAAFATYALTPFVTLTAIGNHTVAGDFLEESGARDQTYVGLGATLRY